MRTERALAPPRQGLERRRGRGERGPLLRRRRLLAPDHALAALEQVGVAAVGGEHHAPVPGRLELGGKYIENHNRTYVSIIVQHVCLCITACVIKFSNMVGVVHEIVGFVIAIGLLPPQECLRPRDGPHGRHAAHAGPRLEPRRLRQQPDMITIIHYDLL